MKAIPAESKISTFLVLALMCSAEKFPSMIKVQMSWSLKIGYECDVLSQYIHMKYIFPSNLEEDLYLAVGMQGRI